MLSLRLPSFFLLALKRCEAGRHSIPKVILVFGTGTLFFAKPASGIHCGAALRDRVAAPLFLPRPSVFLEKDPEKGII
jgi:hypothetical protein